MTDPKHTDTSRSGDLVEEMRDLANAFGDDVKRRYSQDLLREAADRIEALEAENERLRGYAVHALTCSLANYGGAAECTCGLTALIKEIEGD